MSMNRGKWRRSTRKRKRDGPASTSYRVKRRRTGALVVPGYTRSIGYFGGIENKFHTDTLSNATIAAATAIFKTTICGISEGTSEIERDGRRCVVNQIMMRYRLNLPSATDLSDTTDTVRVMVYLDTQCNGLTAATGDLLFANTYLSFNNLANRSRFRVLYDKIVTIQCPGAAGNTTTDTTLAKSAYFSWYKKCNIPLEFSGSNGNLTELRSNNIGVLVASKNGLCNIDGDIRLRFTG